MQILIIFRKTLKIFSTWIPHQNPVLISISLKKKTTTTHKNYSSYFIDTRKTININQLHYNHWIIKQRQLPPNYSNFSYLKISRIAPQGHIARKLYKPTSRKHASKKLPFSRGRVNFQNSQIPEFFHSAARITNFPLIFLKFPLEPFKKFHLSIFQIPCSTNRSN